MGYDGAKKRPEDIQHPQSPQTPEQARQAAVNLIIEANQGQTSSDFLNCCAPYRSRTERPAAGNFEYWTRIQASAVAWLRMSQEDRQMLISGAEDGVRWRGESLDVYMLVYQETQKLREVGSVGEYLKTCPAIVRELGRLRSGE